MRTIKKLTAFGASLFLSVSPFMVLTPVRVHAATVTNGKIFYRSDTDGDRDVYSVNSNGTSGTNLTDANAGVDGAAQVSPDGTKVAYLSDSAGAYDIFVMDIDGANKTNVTNSAGVTEFGLFWSPDGTKLAYYIDADGNTSTVDYNISIINATGGTPVSITNDASATVSNQGISWAPDSSKIAYEHRTSGPGGFSNIFSVNANGANSQQLTNTTDTYFNGDAMWSPNGSKIVFTSNTQGAGGSRQMFTMNADGSSETLISNQTANNDDAPRWSLDGSQLVFFSDRDGDNEIFTVASTGGSPTKLTTNSSADSAPSWSPDGTKIVFLTDRDGNAEVYVMDSDGSSPLRLTNNSTVNDSFGLQGWQTLLVPTTSSNAQGGTTTTVESDEDFSNTDFTLAANDVLVNNGTVGDVTVGNGATLKGTGTVGVVTVNTGGHLAPGLSPGCLSSGNLTLSGSLDEEIGGTTVCTQYDQTQVTGTVNVNNATLNVTHVNSFVPAVGNTFTIISNDAADAVTGTFTGLAQGATFTVGTVTYSISYTGGDGNDVVLTVTAVAATPAAPNTGFNAVLNNPASIMFGTTSIAGAILALSRKYNLLKGSK